MGLVWADHGGFLEAKLSGIVEDGRDSHAAAAPFAGRDGVRRLLVTYEDVESIAISRDRLVATAVRYRDLGVMVAIYAPTDFSFGLNRQILQLAGQEEGVTAMVFRDRAEAVRWLLRDL